MGAVPYGVGACRSRVFLPSVVVVRRPSCPQRAIGAGSAFAPSRAAARRARPRRNANGRAKRRIATTSGVRRTWSGGAPVAEAKSRVSPRPNSGPAATRFRQGSSACGRATCGAAERPVQRFFPEGARGFGSWGAAGGPVTRFRSRARSSAGGTYLRPGGGAVTRQRGLCGAPSRRARPARAGSRPRGSGSWPRRLPLPTPLLR